MKRNVDLDKKGFTMPELMVLLLALSIMFAAAAPIISKRQPSLSSNDLPAGAIIIWSGDSIPKGYVLCDGSTAPNGYDTPDLRGVLPVGVDSTHPWNTTGGAYTHTLSTPELPAHNHFGTFTVAGTNHVHSFSGGVTSSTAHTHPLSNSSTGSPHSHACTGHLTTPPPAVTNYMLAFAGANGTLYPASFALTYYTYYCNDNSHGHTATSTTTTTAHTHTLDFPAAGDHKHAGSLSSVGGGTSFSTMPQYKAYYYIMKYE